MNKTSDAPVPTPVETTADIRRDSPGVMVFPPVLYVGTLLLGLLLNYFWPAHLFPMRWVRVAGAVLVVASGMIAHWAQKTMRRAGTNVLPSQPSLAIVTAGPFRFTRNPIYVANAFVYLGLTLILNTLWPIVLFGPMLFALNWGIIRREERYLEAKFGAAYLDYKARVRRWI